MLKRLLLLSLVVLSSISCNKVITIYAQTLPITKGFCWDARPGTEGVLNYEPQLDDIDLSMTNPLDLCVRFTITTEGAHVLRVRARNFWGVSDYTVLNINVKTPGGPTNPRVTQ